MATKAATLPESHWASSWAMLSAEGTNSASSACCSVRDSPRVTCSTESDAARSAA